MKSKKVLNKRYETIGWGIVLILIGVLNFIPGEQNNVFVLGVGIILLGLNLSRYLSKIPTSWVTITLGVIAVIISLAVILQQLLNYSSFEIPLFPLCLISIGIILLGYAVKPTQNVPQ